MSDPIAFRRGLAASRPVLNPGEPGCDLDPGAFKFFVGSPAGNVQIYPPLVSGSPAISGTPATNELTFWASATEVGGLPQVTWDSGNSRLVLANTSGFQWASRTLLTAPDDGSLRISNSAGNDFGRVIFGGTGIAFPSLKRDGAGLQVRLADDSDFGNFEAEAVTVHDAVRLPERLSSPASILGQGQLYTKSSDSHLYFMDGSGAEVDLLATTGTVTGTGTAGQITFWTGVGTVGGDTGLLYDSTSDLLQFGGTTALYPALKRVGTELQTRLADDSNSADFRASAIVATNYVTSLGGIGAGASNAFAWSGRSRLYAAVDGNIHLTNAAANDFGLLQFGGTTSAYPALKRSGPYLVARLADDSADTDFIAGSLISTGNIRAATFNNIQWTGSTRMYASADGDLRLVNAAENDFGLLQFGGFTAAYPAWKRFGSSLEARLADDSGQAAVYAKDFFASDNIFAGADDSIQWTGRSRMYSDTSGNIRLVDNTNIDFGLLQFGGVTSSYPALKRDSDSLQVRLADDSGYAVLRAGVIISEDQGVRVPNIGQFYWNNRAMMKSPADGEITLLNFAETDFGLLQFGGTTSAYPALKRVGTQIQVRLADDSADAGLTTTASIFGGAYTVTNSSSYAWNSRSRLWSDADGNIRLTDSATTDFGLLQFGGTSAAFPALKRVGTEIQVRLADDSTAAGLWAGGLYSTGVGTVQAGSTSYFLWNNRSRMYSDADGNIRLTDSSAADFGLLQFGGTTAAFPALKRSGTSLLVRLADDTAPGNINANVVQAGAYFQAVSTGYFEWASRSRLYSPSDGEVRFRDNADAAYATIRANSVIAQTGSLVASTAGEIEWSGLTTMTAPADGDLLLTNNAKTAFGLLQFGGTSNLFPALKRSGTSLQVRLADDSNFAVLEVSGLFSYSNVRCGSASQFNWQSRSEMFSPADGDILLTNNAGADFGLLQFGGTGAGFPALKRSGSALLCRLADDSDFTTFTAKSLNAADNITLGTNQPITWTSRSQIYSPADGNFQLVNAAGTDFGLLQFGGTGAGFPALKRVGAVLVARTADDLAYANFTCGGLLATGNIETSGGNSISWGTRTQMTSPVDGDLLLRDDLGSAFGLLQLGGTTNGYPALKRSGAVLQARLADDSADTLVQMSVLRLAEQASSPSDTLNYGQLFIKSSDSKLYYRNETGSEFDLISSSGVTGSGNVGELAYWSTGTQLSSDPKLAVNTTTGGMLMSICRLTEQASSPGDTANIGQLFTRSSDSHLIYRADTGTEYDLTLTAGVTGGGAAGRPAIWTGASTLADDADYTWDSANNRLGITSAFTLEHDASDAIIKSTTGSLLYQAEEHSFTSDTGGTADVFLHINSVLGWKTGASLYATIGSPADGRVTLYNNNQTSFDLLQFGGTTNAYPALQRQGAQLNVRTADNSGAGSLACANFVAQGFVQAGVGDQIRWAGRTEMSAPADGNLLLTDSLATTFGLLQLGGTSSLYPALRRNGAAIDCRLASDTGYASFVAKELFASATGRILWSTRSSLSSPADGDILLTNNAVADFGLLQFGGTTNLFPALKRDGAALYAMLADDSGPCDVFVDDLFTNSASGSIRAGQSGFYYWTGRSRIYSDADGDVRITDADGLDHTGVLQFGKTDATRPGLKHNGTFLQVRLADDSGYASLQCANVSATDWLGNALGKIAWGANTVLKSPGAGQVTLLNFAEDDFDLLQFGGTTSAFPALKRSGAGLVARLADDSNNAIFSASQLLSSSLIRASGASYFEWSSRSRMYSPADGSIRLTDNAGTDFGLLQFGGTSALFPALKRSTTRIQLRLADDSAFANFEALNFYAQSTVRLGTGTGSYVNIGSTTGNVLTLTDNTGADFSRIAFGGTTLAYPAIKRVSDELQIRLADDSDFADLQVENLTVNGTLSVPTAVFADIEAGATNYIGWTGRSRMVSEANGTIRLHNSTDTGFDRLLFGPTTAAGAAWRLGTGAFEARRGDDTGRADVYVGNMFSGGVVDAAAASYHSWNTRSRMYSDADGNIRLSDSTGLDFGLLQFGGTTALFPALKRGGTQLVVRLADDSGYADVVALSLYATGAVRAGDAESFYWTTRSRLYSDADSNIRLSNNAGTDFGLLQFGGATSAFSALKRSGTELHVRLADDSNYGNFTANVVFSAGYHLTGASGFYAWSGRSTIYSPADGSIRLSNAAGTDFGLLQFGGTGGTYPALKRSGLALLVRSADDAAYADFAAKNVQARNVFEFPTSTKLSAPSDGRLLLSNDAETDFSLLQFGGTSNLFPALKRSANNLFVRLADDSNWATLQTGSILVNGASMKLYEQATAPTDTPNYGALYVRQSDNALIYRKDTGTEYDLTLAAGVSGGGTANALPVWTSASVLGDSGLFWDSTPGLLQFGGTTSSYPALKNSGGILAVRNADDTSYANIYANGILGFDYVRAGAAQELGWSTRSQMFSDVDGSIRLTNAAGTDFDLLQFGGTTSAFPALKRDGSSLACRVADDTAYTTLLADSLYAASGGSVSWDSRARITSPSYGALQIQDFALAYNAELTVGKTLTEPAVLTSAGTDDYALFVRQTLNDPTSGVGSQTISLIKGDLSITDDTGWDIIYLMDLQVDGVTQFNVAKTGAVANMLCTGSYFGGGNVQCGSGSRLGIQGRSGIDSPTDGNLRLFNNAGTDFGLLQFGGTTAAFPAIRRSGTKLEVVTADGLSFSNFQVARLDASGDVVMGDTRYLGWGTRSRLYSDADGNVRLTNTAGTDFGSLQLGGTTSAYPALKRSGTQLQARLADDSQYADFAALTVQGINRILVGGGGWVEWSARSKIYSDADGSIRLTDSAGTDFSLLQFGGTTDSYPALKRVGVRLEVRSADDTLYRDLQINKLHSNTGLLLGNNAANHANITPTGAASKGDLSLTNSSGDDFGLLQFGGTTSAYPALKRNTTFFDARLADDSGYAGIRGLFFSATSYVRTSSTSYFEWDSRSRMYSPVDGTIQLTDAAGTDFGLLQFGGTTASYPALKRSGDAVRARLADDSADTVILAKQFWATTFGVKLPGASGLEFTSASRILSYADGNITLTDAAIADFGLLQFGGTTSAYPAIERNGDALRFRLADDSGYANISAQGGFFSASVQVGSPFYFNWLSRSRMYSDADGDIRLTNNAGTDFGLLQFGGTTGFFPALRRNGTILEVRLADDSAYSRFRASTLMAESTGQLRFISRSRLLSDADGNFRLTDEAETDFSLLQFGGTTNSYPALKRVGTILQVRLADDSGLAGFATGALNSYSFVTAGTFTNADATDWAMSVSPTLNDPTGPATGNDFAAILVNPTLTSTAGWENVYLLDLQADGFSKLRVETDGHLITEAHASFAELSSSPSDVSGYGKIFARSSDSALIYRTGTGTEYDLTQAAGVTGGGAAGRIALWTGASDLGDDADFLWNSATNQLSLAGITLETAQGGIKQTVPTITSAGADDYALMVTQTLNDSSVDTGTQEYRLIKGDLNVTDITGWDNLYLMDLQVDGVSKFLVANNGDVTANNLYPTGLVQTNAGQAFGWATRSRIYSNADGNVRLSNNAGTDFGLLQFGGVTSAYPALKRSTNELQVRLADDSGYARIDASTFFSTGNVITAAGGRFDWNGRSRMYSDADGNIRLTDVAGTDFGLLQFGGTSASFPALKRVSDRLEVRTASDSAYAQLTADALTASASVNSGATSYHGWSSRSRMYSDADGNIRLSNTAGTDFGLLQFGGTTNAYPALKRVGGVLQARTADDTSFAGFYAGATNLLPPTLTSAGSDNYALSIAQTLNDTTPDAGGTQTYRMLDARLTITDAAGWDDVYLMDFQEGATTRFSVNSAGLGYFDAGIGLRSTSLITWSGRTRLASQADGDLLLRDSSTTDFGLLQFGGTSASYPAIEREAAFLRIRLADNSGFAALQCGAFTANESITCGLAEHYGWGIARSRMLSDADGDIRLTDSAETDFGLLQFGGTTSAFPAIGRHPTDTDAVQLRRADDSAFAVLYCHAVSAQPGELIYWNTRTRMSASADGSLLLTNAAADDFGLIQFGGTTSSYPALKRDATVIRARLADDSAGATLAAGALSSDTSVGANASSTLTWIGRTKMWSDADGDVLLTTNAPSTLVAAGTADFGMLKFGGNTSAYPALKRSGTELQARLADDSNWCPIRTGSVVSAGIVACNTVSWFEWNGRSRMYSDSDGNIRLTDTAGTDFGLLQFGGTTSSYPALKRTLTGIEVKLADDSAYATLRAGTLKVSGTSVFNWDLRSSLASPSDGVVDVQTNAGGLGAIRTGRDVEANTAGTASPNALTAAESYKVFTNEAATEKNFEALPPAAAGIQYTFVVQDSDGMRIVAQTGDTIRVAASVSTSGGYVESTTVGDVITLVAINSTEWFAIHVVGTGWATA